MSHRFSDVAALKDELAGVDYLSDEGIAGVVYLADRLQKPILVEGPAGTGKTQLAKSVSEITGARLIRLQCYEGLDEAKALYEWNYKKQLLRIQAEGGSDEDWTDLSDDIFSDEFLLTRPLLEAIRSEEPVVLLIDEVDRVEVETEALLLEILSDYQVSIPELGTIEAKQIPLVFLTSNNTRELSEALKRRCSTSTSITPTWSVRRRSSSPRSPTSPRTWPTRSLVSFARSDRSSSRSTRASLRPRLGEDARAARCREDRRADRGIDDQHPLEVPERHQQGAEGTGYG